MDIKARVEKLVSRGWTEEDACNWIENSIANGEPDEDDWYMVYDRKQKKYVDLRLED